jgi:hypothetical protein
VVALAGTARGWDDAVESYNDHLERRMNGTVWNTVYTQRILDQLRADGQLITTSEIEQISPLPHQHINAYGHHTFNLASRPTDYRPLRAPQHATPPAAKTLNRV